MSPRITRSIFAILLVAASLAQSPRALAQPLADRIPGDALVYVGWAGAENMGPGYEQSRLKAVLDASSFPQLVNESLPKFFQKLGATNREAAEFTSIFSAIGGPMWKRPTAIYFGGLDMTSPERPMPRFAVICEAGPDAQAMADQMRRGLAQAPIPLQVQQQGTTVVLQIGGNFLQRPAQALPSAAKFKAAAGQVGGAKNAVATVYIDVEGLAAMGDQIVKGDDDVSQNWNKIKNTLGLTGIRRAIWSAGFDGKDWMGQAFVDVPAPRRGIIPGLFDAKPLSDAVYKSIPQTATVASAARFDLGALFKNIRSAVASFDPDAGQAFEGALAQVKEMIGLDVQTDLLDALGDEWAIYVDPPSTGSGMLGFVVVNRPRDANKLDASLTKLEDLANNMIKQNMEPPMTIEVKRATVGNAKLRYLAVPFVSPTWSVQGGNLYLGLYPQVVAGAIDNTASGKSILDNAEFQAVRQRLGAQPNTASITGFSFANLPQTAPDGYQELMMATRIYLGFADMFGADTPPFVLPPLRKILPHLVPAGSVSWVDQQGWHHKSITPFPGAGALTPGAGGQVVLAQQAMLAGILLPSLNRARETANRVKCGSNMRQIGQAILLYANENKGRYPPDLGTLITTQDITVDAFVCPSGEVAVPQGLQPQQAAQWVNENAAYIYVGKGLTFTAGPDTVVLYEKPDNHEQQGMNILYGDGHVDFLLMPQALEEIQKAQAQQRQRAAQPQPRR